MSSIFRFNQAARISSIALFLIAMWLRDHRAAQRVPYNPNDGLIAVCVRHAHETGKTSIRMPYPMIEWAELEDLDHALSHTTAVVAGLVASETVYTKNEIATWRKYATIEKLSRQLEIPARPCDEIPASLLPLKLGEFVIPEIGGTVEVDGVRLIQQDPMKNDIPAQDHHLMFLLFYCAGPSLLKTTAQTVTSLWTIQTPSIFRSGHRVPLKTSY